MKPSKNIIKFLLLFVGFNRLAEKSPVHLKAIKNKIANQAISL